MCGEKVRLMHFVIVIMLEFKGVFGCCASYTYMCASSHIVFEIYTRYFDVQLLDDFVSHCVLSAGIIDRMEMDGIRFVVGRR